MTYWVTMTDRFLSGWGCAQGKINKLVIECQTMDQALIVAQNAKSRKDMIYINIVSQKPYYNINRYLVSRHGKTDYKAWFIPGFFK